MSVVNTKSRRERDTMPISSADSSVTLLPGNRLECNLTQDRKDMLLCLESFTFNQDSRNS